MKSMPHQFLDWLRRQPPKGQYLYSSSTNCAICQFLRAEGYAERPVVYHDVWRTNGGKWHDLPDVMDASVRDHATYGAAAKRLAMALAA